MNQTLAFVLVAGPLLAGQAGADCRHSADRSTRIEGDGIRKVVIGAGAGDMVVRGDDGRNGVVVDARACADSERLLDQIRLETRREGDTVYLKTVMPEVQGHLFNFWNMGAYMDLAVSVPKSVELAVDDSSGDLEVRNVATAVIADSSGDTDVDDIGGELKLTDSSGDVRVRQVGGNVRLKDSSGDVEIYDVEAGVEISVDSSGDLTIERVAGDVHILNDSSGDIEIADVQRNVVIDSDSSGGIHVNRISGDFTVSADSSGDISHGRVMGAVHLPEDR